MNIKHMILLAVVAGAVWQSQAKAQVVDLGSASNFAILAGSGITFTTGATTITGDIGTYSTTTIDGTGTFNFVTGADHAGDAFTQAAKTALAAAYADAAGRAATSVGTALSGTITPGVYTSGTFGITGTLTLDALGDPNAVFIFKTGLGGTTLITADSSQVLLTGSAQANNVFWQVGSSATLGASSVFEGNVLAFTSITLGADATVDGRLLAQNAHVTLGGNDTITAVPEPATTSVLIAGFLGLVVGIRRIRRHNC